MGGPVSLDESALAGILAPLAYPYLLCQRGSVVLGTGSVGGPTSTPGSAPAATPAGVPAPPTSSTPNTNKDCGLFKLNLFCLNGCGLIGRLLRLCRKANDAMRG